MSSGDEGEMFEVSYISGRRVVRGEIQYKVHWVGYDEDAATWEREENCEDSAHYIQAFLEQQKEKMRAPSLDYLPMVLPCEKLLKHPRKQFAAGVRSSKRVKSSKRRISILDLPSSGSVQNMEEVFMENISRFGLAVDFNPKSDGNCFFHCCIKALEQSGGNEEFLFDHASLRTSAVQYLESKMENYRHFIEGMEPAEYCRQMERETEWADHLIIQVTSAMLERRITIITCSAENRKVDIVPNNNNEQYLYMTPIYLGYIQNAHYITLKHAGPVDNVKIVV